MSHLRCDSGLRPQWLPPGGSCQKSALRNRFLTEEECRQKGWLRYKYKTWEILTFQQTFAFPLSQVISRIPLPPSLRSATFPPGEGMRLRRHLTDKWQFCTLHFAFCISCISTINPNLDFRKQKPANAFAFAGSFKTDLLPPASGTGRCWPRRRKRGW